jgi:hypothetical protein
MHQMEGAAGIAGLGAIMDHRRHDESIFQRETANCEGLEQLRLRSPAPIGWSITHRRFSFANWDSLSHVTKSLRVPAVGLLCGFLGEPAARWRESDSRSTASGRAFSRGPHARALVLKAAC